ncbi:SAF domain-containing protein [Gordonia sp. VNK1]|uniref:SAF domain-containing protein n=1 Tax=Gordonia oleivorans TaxID=3156618 RepID=UPI0032B619A2
MRLPLTRTTMGPRLRDRAAHAMRPGWARSVAIRRTMSLVLIAAAVAVGLHGQRTETHTSVLVAAHDLAPGHALVAADLRQQSVPVELVPEGALRLAADGEAHTVTGPIGSGEIVTGSRLLSPRLPVQLTGDDDARLVPVRLADDTVASLVRAGDVVDVLTADTDVLATGAIVAVVPTAVGASPTRASATPPILLAMGRTAAHRVAGAGLDVPLAVVLH